MLKRSGLESRSGMTRCLAIAISFLLASSSLKAQLEGPNPGSDTPGSMPSSSSPPSPEVQSSSATPDSTKVELIKGEMPVYPPADREKNLRGPVWLRLHISEAGDVEGVDIISGDPILAEVAVEAVKKWKFKPYIKNGYPAKVLFKTPIEFAFDKQSKNSRNQSIPGTISKADRERALNLLDNVSKYIHDTYFDPKMNGLDWNGVVERAREKIVGANSLNEALTDIAIAVNTLNDSHTTFRPPPRPSLLDFGFHYQMIGNSCLVTRVRPGSDGEGKGLKPGDEILTINGTSPSRQNLWNIEYLEYVLNPWSEMRLRIRELSGQEREVGVDAKLTPRQYLNFREGMGGNAWYDGVRKNQNAMHLMRMQLARLGEVGVLKFPWFFYSVDELDALASKIRKDQALIVDLRGNHGGAVDTMKYFTGMFLDHDVKVYDRVERKKTSAEVVKSEHHNYFSGKLIVLVDGESASAAEIFARVMQLEKRATVIGDRTSGSVMEAISLPFSSAGVDYSAEITVANLIMRDGQSLEHHGVTPDEMMLPTPTDLASGQDPVLAYAAKQVGATISSEDAGKLFPYEWPKVADLN